MAVGSGEIYSVVEQEEIAACALSCLRFIPVLSIAEDRTKQDRGPEGCATQRKLAWNRTAALHLYHPFKI